MSDLLGFGTDAKGYSLVIQGKADSAVPCEALRLL